MTSWNVWIFLVVAVFVVIAVFGKVRVADVATIKSGLRASARQSALNRIVAKHFDFIVCRADDLTVVCAVELNDKSHCSQRARARDALLARVCETIHLPLLTIPAGRTYTLQDLKVQFRTAISGPQRSTSHVRSEGRA